MNPATDTREAKSSDLIQGTLEMLILKTLALEPMHGYGVGPAHRADQRRSVQGECRIAASGAQPHGARRRCEV